jgi:hypothetical protein
MWLAVCADRQCQWQRGACSRVSAEAQLAWHTRETCHPGAAVDVQDAGEDRRLDVSAERPAPR